MNEYLNIVLKGDDDNEYSLKKFIGRKVVLYFYPADNTPGCSIQSKKYTDQLEEFKKYNAKVIGCSPKGVQSKINFKTKKHLKHLLLADEEYKLATALNIIKKTIFTKGVERTTFILNEQGEIIYEVHNVKPYNDTEEALAFLKEYKEASERETEPIDYSPNPENTKGE